MSNKVKNILLTAIATFQGVVLWICDKVASATDFYELPSIVRNFSDDKQLTAIQHSWADIPLKVYIGGFICSVIIYLINNHSHKRWLRRLLQHIMDQDLLGNNAQTRITIYTKRWGFTKFIPTFLYVLRMIITSRFDWNYLKMIPVPWHKYLFPYVRHSYPDKSPSYTHFRVTSTEQMPIHSLVQKCYKEGIVVKQNISAQIGTIDFTKSFKNLTNSERKQIDKYAKDSEMNLNGESAYAALKLMQRRANQFYAVPLLKGCNVWGVFIVDATCESNKLNITVEMDKVCDNYQKIIQFTFDEKL